MKYRKHDLAGLLLIALSCAFASGASAVEVSKIRGGTSHDTLLSVAFDGNRGLAVGGGGTLMSTEDGGATWVPETAPTKLLLTAAAIRGKRRLVTGQMGEIFFDDGSGAWKKAVSGTTERLLGASINADGVALAVGAFGLFIRSEDGGKTWQQLAANWDPLFAEAADLGPGFQPQLYGVQIDDAGTALVVGEFETIVRSDDAGRTWETALVGNVTSGDRPPTLFAVRLSKDHRAYAVGQSGVIMSSDDSGRSWCRLNSGTDTNLFDVASFENGDVVVSGMRKMLYAKAGGQQWDLIAGEDVSTAWYSSVSANAHGDVIAVGQRANILRISP